MNQLSLPFKEEVFDVVLCNHVLEHIIDDKKAMAEIFRVLKIGGIAILQVPVSHKLIHTYEDCSITEPEQRKKAFGQFDHVRIYGMDYPQRLESIGFKVEKINISQQYPKYGLNPEEDLFVCHKYNKLIKKL